MFRYLIGGADVRSVIISMLLTLPVILLSLSAHEAAHGYVAYLLGDPTARNLGRVTLNPARHLDPIGFLCMLLCGFGWAHPVPITSRNFRNPRRGMAISALAGPAANLILSFLFLLLLRFVGYGWLARLSYPSETALYAAYYFLVFLYYGVTLNLTLAVFNLLPVPPLDGSRILFILLPPRLYFKVARYERYLVIAVMLLLLLGPLSWLIQFITSSLTALLFRLVGLPAGFPILL